MSARLCWPPRLGLERRMGKVDYWPYPIIERPFWHLSLGPLRLSWRAD